jgi:hypothetical protein
MSENEDGNDIGTPPEIIEIANKTTLNLLPDKSVAKYELCYKQFMEWSQENKANSQSENVLLAYFNMLAKKLKPSTLWSHYSMLKSTINVKNNVNITNYKKLHAFLKKKSQGYRPKKSKILTSNQINTFLKEASDNKY